MFDVKEIKRLRQRKVDLKAQADQILALVEKEARPLLASERAQLDAIKAQLAQNENSIVEAEAELDAERYAPAARTAGGGFSVGEHDAPAGGKLYAQMFPGALSNNGFKSREEFFKTVHSGLNDQRFYAGMTEAVPSEGGFMVPSQFSAELLDAAIEDEIVRPRASVYPMTSDSRKIAGFDGLDNSAGAPYGFSAQWLAEAGTGTNRVGKTRLIQLDAKKLALFSQVSNELIADGMSFEELLGQAMRKAMSFGLDAAFFQGTGAGQPLGVLADPSLIVISKEGSQSAASIQTANILKMYARLYAGGLKSAVWVANPTTIPQLLQLTLGSGTAVTQLLTQQDGQWRMLTLPVLWSEKLPVLGQKGDILLADFSQYAIGLRREISIDKSQHVGWMTDESGYRIVVRVDGQGKWGKPYTPKNGDTQSWCVVLETR